MPKLSRGNFRPLFDDIAEVVERSLILPVRHRATNIKVDLALGLSGFERQVIARAESVELAGCRLPVATAEDLLIMKVLAGRPRDDEDARGLVIAQAQFGLGLLRMDSPQLGEAIGIDLAARIRAMRTLGYD